MGMEGFAFNPTPEEQNRKSSVSHQLFRRPLFTCSFDTQIKWSNRKKHGGSSNRWSMVTVDGTDFRIQEPTPFSKGWYSHKFHGPAVRYEVAVSINGGDIVHINGPFQCGFYPDITIFRTKLMGMLEDGEFVEADKGYRGEPTKVRVPVDYQSSAEKRQKALARTRHETVNKRFKQFNILGNRFRHHVSFGDMKLHKLVFESVAVITQLDISLGNSLFRVVHDGDVRLL